MTNLLFSLVLSGNLINIRKNEFIKTTTEHHITILYLSEENNLCTLLVTSTRTSTSRTHLLTN